MKTKSFRSFALVACTSAFLLSALASATELPCCDLVSDLVQLDTPPTALSQRPPRYPKQLKDEGITGEVLVILIVDSAGNPASVHIERSSHSEFGQAALEAAQTWRFSPGMKNGQPVACRLAVPVVFSLPK